MVIVAGVLVAWVLRRFRPLMPLSRRILYIVGGAILIGGFFYGAIVNR